MGTTPALAQPIPLRQVSGSVKDSTDEAVIGALVVLTSKVDTFRTSTNADGIYVFRGVKSWEFTISVTYQGSRTFVKKGLYNDSSPRLTMDPIILVSEAKLLNEIVIKGTPSITYKTDTVEYRASDYVVRAGATVDELLKKMEGMEVGTDGSLTYNGSAVTKARVNGKDYFGGDVATAIQNLPAEIVSKAQIIDDYGDLAARTGIKDGEAQKVLNIATRADKSVGNTATINVGGGTLNQYEGSVFATRINGNQEIGLQGNFSKIPNGIAGAGASIGRLGGANNRGGRSGAIPGGAGVNSGTGGSISQGSPRLTFRDDFGKKVHVNSGYSYSYRNANIITNSISENFSTLGTTYGTNNGTGINKNNTHTFNFDLEYDIDSANYLQVRPNLSFTSSSNTNNSTLTQTGLIHQDQINRSVTDNSALNLGGTISYQHYFKKPNRIFSAELSRTNRDTKNDQEQNNIITYYQTSGTIDSLVHRLLNTDNLSNVSRVSLTFGEPIGKLSRLEFNANVEYTANDNSKITSALSATGTPLVIDSLSNIFDYSFTQSRYSLNYRYGTNSSKYSFSLGATAIPTSLSGNRLGVTTSRKDFKMIPIARFQLRMSRTHLLSLNYNGTAIQPDFEQIQPVRDISDPQNPRVGNPDLKASFSHRVNMNYSNYIANSKLNYTLGINSTFTEHQVTTNIVQVKDSYNSLKNEIRYVNMDGNYQVGGTYTVSKQSNNREYNYSLTGEVTRQQRKSMSNSIENTASTWGFKESFGPRINPNTWLEINPYVSYDVNKTDYSLPQSKDIIQKVWSLSVDGSVYFLKNFQFSYAVSKNYVSGINNNRSTNPFVINTMLQTRVFKNRAALQLRAFDLLNQNNFVNRVTTANGFTETLTNPNSRYFMINLSMNLQKWTGAPKRNGMPIPRRGDGSFIN
nr:TonB-dependent receptor [uncultured Mucilaginibacter sp.]